MLYYGLASFVFLLLSPKLENLSFITREMTTKPKSITHDSTIIAVSAEKKEKLFFFSPLKQQKTAPAAVTNPDETENRG